MNPWFLTLCDHRTPGLGYFIVRSYFIIARVTVCLDNVYTYFTISADFCLHTDKTYTSCIYIYSFVPPRGTTQLPPQSASAVHLSGSPASLIQVRGGWGGINNVHDMLSNNTETHKPLRGLQNRHLPCQIYFSWVSDRTSNTSQFRHADPCFFDLLWAMDPWIADCIALLGILQTF